MTPAGDELRFDWRRGGAAAGALIAALVLLIMVFLVSFSNQARDDALKEERHAYDVALVARSVDSSLSRAEAALGRFVLDEEIDTSGSIYYANWRLAGFQIQQLERLVRQNPAQLARVEELRDIYQRRGNEFALAAKAAAANMPRISPTCSSVWSAQSEQRSSVIFAGVAGGRARLT